MLEKNLLCSAQVTLRKKFSTGFFGDTLKRHNQCIVFLEFDRLFFIATRFLCHILCPQADGLTFLQYAADCSMHIINDNFLELVLPKVMASTAEPKAAMQQGNRVHGYMNF